MLATPLRTGKTPWMQDAVAPARAPSEFASPIQTDILIVGAGITGAFLAEAFSRTGKKIIVLDRHPPQTASTMASSALLAWEIDTPLSQLAARLGFEKAAEAYRATMGAVRYIAELVGELRLDCAFAPRQALYLEGKKLSGEAFRKEAALRKRAGLPVTLLTPQEVSQLYGFPPCAAMHTGANAEADPVALARELLLAAMARGTLVISPANISNFDFEGRKVYARADEGVEIIADTLLLATGYEMPNFVRAVRYRIVSTFVVATVPQENANLWRGRDLIWNADDPYFYMRTMKGGRVIIGGEDEKIADADSRDALLPQKAKLLQGRLHTLRPHADITLDYKWSGLFAITDDALPIIGRVPSHAHAYAAYGYGGNGIAFAALAAQILRDEILGLNSEIPAKEAFALDRA
jgi:glycine/D-amino acid oxidase-like deaminating enzyme